MAHAEARVNGAKKLAEERVQVIQKKLSEKESELMNRVTELEKVKEMGAQWQRQIADLDKSLSDKERQLRAMNQGDKGLEDLKKSLLLFHSYLDLRY